MTAPVRYTVRAVERVLDILDVLGADREGASLRDIAQRVGLPRSSTYRLLCTLEQHGYARRDDESGNYRVGMSLLFVPDKQLLLLRRVARPYLEGLQQRFGETINFGVLDGNRIAYLDILESPSAVRMASKPGDREPVHSTALGKAIAAELPEPQVLRILELAGMPRRTDRTITKATDFLRELKAVRAKGFAVDDGEEASEGRCIAVAAHNTPIPCAISLSAPATRFSIDRASEVAKDLKAAVRALERKFAATHN